MTEPRNCHLIRWQLKNKELLESHLHPLLLRTGCKRYTYMHSWSSLIIIIVNRFIWKHGPILYTHSELIKLNFFYRHSLCKCDHGKCISAIYKMWIHMFALCVGASSSRTELNLLRSLCRCFFGVGASSSRTELNLCPCCFSML